MNFRWSWLVYSSDTAEPRACDRQSAVEEKGGEWERENKKEWTVEYENDSVWSKSHRVWTYFHQKNLANMLKKYFYKNETKNLNI